MTASKKTTIAQARKAKQEVAKRLQERPELTGVGISLESYGYSVKVHLSTCLPDNVDLPETVLDVPVETEIVGKAYAF